MLTSKRGCASGDDRLAYAIAQIMLARFRNHVLSFVAPDTCCCVGFDCGHGLSHSFSPHGRNPGGTVAVTQVSAVLWPAPQHDHQAAWSRRSRPCAVDSAGDDHRRLEGSIATAR